MFGGGEFRVERGVAFRVVGRAGCGGHVRFGVLWSWVCCVRIVRWVFSAEG